MNEKQTPQTENEKRLLEVIRRIHAGHNLAGGFLPYETVCRSTQLAVLDELANWDK